MPRPRFTVRWLMVAVAIVATTMTLYLRHERFTAKAKAHQSKGRIISKRGILIYPQYVYHRTLSDKYARAARYPWLPVAPDPPEPE